MRPAILRLSIGRLTILRRYRLSLHRLRLGLCNLRLYRPGALILRAHRLRRYRRLDRSRLRLCVLRLYRLRLRLCVLRWNRLRGFVLRSHRLRRLNRLRNLRCLRLRLGLHRLRLCLLYRLCNLRLCRLRSYRFIIYQHRLELDLGAAYRTYLIIDIDLISALSTNHSSVSSKQLMVLSQNSQNSENNPYDTDDQTDDSQNPTGLCLAHQRVCQGIILRLAHRDSAEDDP